MKSLLIYHAPIFSTQLHLIKGSVRTTHQVVIVIPLQWIFCISQRNMKLLFFPVITKCSLAFRKLLQPMLHLSTGAIRKKNTKFISAVTSHHRLFSKILLHLLCKDLQRSIPGSMSIHIIDQLKIIYIKLHSHARLFRMLFQILFYLLIKSMTIINPRQGIGNSKPFKSPTMLIKDQKCSGKTCEKHYNQQTSQRNHVQTTGTEPSLPWHNLQLPPISGHLKNIRNRVRQLSFGSGNHLIGLLPSGNVFGKPVIISKIRKCFHGICKNIRYTNDHNHKSPENFLPIIIFQIYRISHGNSTTSLF